MTDQELNEKVAMGLGWKHEFSKAECELIWKNPKCGTSWFECNPYSSSHDACREIFEFMDARRPAGSVAMLGSLRDVLAPQMPKNSAGSPIISDYDLLMATPREICEAFLKAVEKLKKEKK